MHCSLKRQFGWSGTKVHVTEICDKEAAHLVTHVATCPAMQPDMAATAGIHERLAAKGLLPAEHVVDSAYVDAALLVGSHSSHGVALEGEVARRGELAGPCQGRLRPAALHDRLGPQAGHLPRGQGLGVLAPGPQHRRQPAHLRPVQPVGLRRLCGPGPVYPN